MWPRVSWLVFVVSTAIVGTGCASNHPIREWQQRLTDYTMKEANGDINVLRESAEMRAADEPRPAQIRFDHNDMSAGGLPPFGDRVDAHGVLVGQDVQASHPVFYFLVGVVERSKSGKRAQVEDIRLVSCTVRDGRHQWTTSRPNQVALSRYVALDDESPLDHPAFPRTEDHFGFEVRNGRAQATHTASGAVWHLP